MSSFFEPTCLQDCFKVYKHLALEGIDKYPSVTCGGVLRVLQWMRTNKGAIIDACKNGSTDPEDVQDLIWGLIGMAHDSYRLAEKIMLEDQ